MQTSSDHFSTAMRDLVDYFDWGYDNNKLVFIYEKPASKRKAKKKVFILVLFFVCWKGLNLLSDILRVKNNRQPTIILKALTMDSKESVKSRSILTELRHKPDPSKKIIVAISQKSLDQFLLDVKKNKTFYKLNQPILSLF